jgi:hypothetical protein
MTPRGFPLGIVVRLIADISSSDIDPFSHEYQIYYRSYDISIHIDSPFYSYSMSLDLDDFVIWIGYEVECKKFFSMVKSLNMYHIDLWWVISLTPKIPWWKPVYPNSDSNHPEVLVRPLKY